jgi:hypothetical protein
MRTAFFSRLIATGLLLAALAGTTGCVAVGGAETKQIPTVGRELQDLKTAHDAGAINDAEYETTKSRLVSGKR